MERKIKALIVDDDSVAREILSKFLEFDHSVGVVGCVEDAASALNAFNHCVPDVIFLDVNMPNEDGIQFAQKLRGMGCDVQIVFTTAFRNYAASAFSLKPIDFLVKPFGFDELLEVIDKLKEHFLQQDQIEADQKIWGRKIPDRLKFKTPKGYCFVNPADILYVKVVGACTELFLKNGEHERLNVILNSVYEEMKTHNFLRINRSIIINLDYLDRIVKNKRQCILKNDDEEYVFSLSRNVFKFFDNMDAIKLG